MKNIIIVILLSVFCNCHKTRVEESAEIDANMVINNEFWGIVPNSIEHAESNTANFTAALSWCHENGYNTIKITKATYYVNGESPEPPSSFRPTGIGIPSDIELDLNGATFIHKPNLSPGYVVFGIYKSRNVKLYNGILIGDKDVHPYSDDVWISHEFGFGIDLRGAADIVIDNLEIYGMTGDAVIIGGDDMYIETGGRICERVTVSNSRLHDCRRQGISVVGGNEIWIRNNEIYNIAGYMPMSGIDLEGELDWPVSNIHIMKNRIYATQTANIIVTKHSRNIDIRENDLSGIVGIGDGDTITVADNGISDGGVYCVDVQIPSKCPTNITIENNTLSESEIRMHVLVWVVIRGNTLTDGTIALSYANGAVYGNTITNTKSALMPSAIIVYSDSSAGKKRFKVFVCDNSIKGNFGYSIGASSSIYVNVLSDSNEMMTFMEEIDLKGLWNAGLDIAD